MIALMLAAQLTSADFAQRLEQNDPMVSIYEQTKRLDLGPQPCDLEADAIQAAAELKRDLVDGYVLIPTHYDLGPDDRKVIEAHIISYEADAASDRIACGA
jgi:hypothetical protein